ncbi:MAG: 23S rRNA (guanosine(2251)-2'-O)-methyltransferase RlmB [Eubacteriales bacterium]|nr:23S rRNA (guanosine(2251)-2'-O)-methyltransferase RlmB [Eubacteriales bacterium]
MDSNIIYGKIPVKNALVGKRKPIRVFLNADHPDPEIQSLARKSNVPVKLISNAELSHLTENKNHQGAAASIPEFRYTPLEKIIEDVKDKKESTIILLDGIEDPVNFGSIIRSATGFGADAIIIGKNRQVPVTGTVSKIATGGEEIVPIAQVTNLSQSIEALKKVGYWIVTSAGEGKDVYDEINYTGKIVLVIGSEGFGVSRLVREHSDFIASIPLPGQVKALNAAIACAVFLSEINSYRRKHQK